MSDQVPAVVLGTGLTALGVVRVLGRGGRPLYCHTPPGSLARRSRWFRELPGGGGGGASSADRPADLLAHLERGGLERAVLFPCSDRWALQVASLPALVRERFTASLPDPGTLRRFTDKVAFAALVSETGVPAPRSWPIAVAEDLDRVPGDAFPSSFLKPRDSQTFFARHGVKAVSVSSRDHACARLRELGADDPGDDPAEPSFLLQEYIPGPADHHYFVDGFVDREGEVRAIFVRRRLRMSPPDFGNSSAMVSVPPEEAGGAVRSIERLLAATGFRGIFSAEFKRDPRSGELRVLEVNARAWWYIEFAARCGVDVCALACADALGEEVATVSHYRTGVSLVYTYYDYFACRALLRAGELGLGEWAGSWARSQRPVFTWDDPWPALVRTANFVRRRLRLGGRSSDRAASARGAPHRRSAGRAESR